MSNNLFPRSTSYLTVCVLFIALGAGNVFGQSVPVHDSYKNTLIEFSEVIAFYEKMNSQNEIKNSYFHYNGATAYATIVQSAGKRRSLAKDKADFFDAIFTSMGIADNAKGLFTDEVLIDTKAGQFWLPIQKSLIGYWEDEVKKGDFVLINIRSYGAISAEKGYSWLFGINAFSANYYDDLWDLAIAEFDKGNEANGLNCVYKMMELSPKDGRNYSMLGYFYYEKGFPDDRPYLLKADSLYDIGQKYTPDYAYQYYQRALVKIRLKEYFSAWENIDMARKLGVPKNQFYQPIMKQLEEALPYETYSSQK